MVDGSEQLIEQGGPFAPLHQPVFRRIWIASLFSNFGQLIQGVGAAWAMTEMTGRADMVALVQTATFAPMIFISLPAGAIADSYDRRRVALVALAIALLGAAGLSLVTLFGLLTPTLLLLFCALVGCGVALFSPAWQASVGEQVPAHTLPQAIALNSISYNIARSFGPAIGGFLVALAGAVAAFVLNALAYLPMMAVMFLWRRKPEKARLPPEAMGRAIISGIRFAMHSPPIRTVWLRLLLTGLLGSSTYALLPLIAHDLLHGEAALFGILLGCYGIGAVFGAFSIASIRAQISDERAVAYCLAIVGICLVGVGISRNVVITSGLLLVLGSAWMVIMALCTISIQMSSPRWVTGRALAAFTTAVCAGLAFGSWGWGYVATNHGVAFAIIASGIAMIASIPVGLFLRMPQIESQVDREQPLTDPDIRLDITGRSGPIALTLEYHVPLDQARAFYTAMLDMEPIRHRTGGYNWSLSRDIATPELWVERYHTPTWHDYLRQRARLTAADLMTWDRAMSFNVGEPVRIHRLLERPFGSVRWSEDVPDRGVTVALPQQGS